jgi:membrane fusion protein, multidrug efflux system
MPIKNSLPHRRAARSHIAPTLMLGVCGLLAACGKGSGGQIGTAPPTPVTVVTLKAGKVNLLRELPGRVSARLVAEVRPQVGGIIKHVAFTEGALVKAGQVLYELDDAPYRAALASAEASRLKAQATLETAQRAAARGDEMFKNKLISEQDHDNLQSAWHQAQADLAAAEAGTQQARINLGYARITAPISGRIGKSSITQGALLVTNQATALATIQQLDQVYVDVTQSSSEWLTLRNELGITESSRGNRDVELVLEDGTQYKQHGQLQFSDVTVDPSTGSFLLRVLVPNPGSLLLPGMYVRAVIREGVLDNSVLAPQQGITRDARGNATALVVAADNKVEQRMVTTLRTVGDQWLVGDGLKAGDRLIVEGLQKIAPGAAVQPTEMASASTSSTSATGG